MKRCVMIMMAAVLSMTAFGQSKFHFGLDYQRGFGWMEKDLHDGEMATPADGYKLAGNTFKLTEWYDVNPSFTVGLGLAFDYYSSPTHGSFPGLQEFGVMDITCIISIVSMMMGS